MKSVKLLNPIQRNNGLMEMVLVPKLHDYIGKWLVGQKRILSMKIKIKTTFLCDYQNLDGTVDLHMNQIMFGLP